MRIIWLYGVSLIGYHTRVQEGQHDKLVIYPPLARVFEGTMTLLPNFTNLESLQLTDLHISDYKRSQMALLPRLRNLELVKCLIEGSAGTVPRLSLHRLVISSSVVQGDMDLSHIFSVGKIQNLEVGNRSAPNSFAVQSMEGMILPRSNARNSNATNLDANNPADTDPDADDPDTNDSDANDSETRDADANDSDANDSDASDPDTRNTIPIPETEAARKPIVYLCPFRICVVEEFVSLTRLSIFLSTESKLDKLFHFLERCPRLESLNITYEGRNLGHCPPLLPSAIPLLSSFSGPSWIASFVIPGRRVDTLALSVCRDYDETIDFDRFEMLLREMSTASGVPIIYLKIYPIPIGIKFVSIISAHFPHLKQLVVDFSFESCNFLPEADSPPLTEASCDVCLVQEGVDGSPSFADGKADSTLNDGYKQADDSSINELGDNVDQAQGSDTKSELQESRPTSQFSDCSVSEKYATSYDLQCVSVSSDDEDPQDTRSLYSYKPNDSKHSLMFHEIPSPDPYVTAVAEGRILVEPPNTSSGMMSRLAIMPVSLSTDLETLLFGVSGGLPPHETIQRAIIARLGHRYPNLKVIGFNTDKHGENRGARWERIDRCRWNCLTWDRGLW
ncbi:hypothetical protein BJ138DRAFT_1147787 [Hygrophoropsis aurantiaca]|uniref:Uncharacterized protein n=1 Tax=Hygrophoropsis aurantiaca TaxID=72124 RepID=A0ACB8AHJ6_9AGAM|nr:hypothetical protein BJ138DRAFT_1147787 [Hygrophoropsis aurantiaca]